MPTTFYGTVHQGRNLWAPQLAASTPAKHTRTAKGVVATCFPQRQCGHGPVTAAGIKRSPDFVGLPMQNRLHRLDRLATLDTELAFDIMTHQYGTLEFKDQRGATGTFLTLRE